MNISSKLLAGAALSSALAVGLIPQAFAYTSDASLAANSDYDDSETIVITGSRIRRSGADTPTPTTIMSSETIDQSGVREIGELVTEIPSLFTTQNNQTSNRGGYAGLNALDLRGLGISRTLVLVNGSRRVPSVPGTSAVDTSAIPSALVERVEVITGGASALYGADAVAGVVNFILKKDFEGFSADIYSGVSTRGDLGNVSFNGLYGKNFGGGRGNVTLFGSYSNSPDMVSGQDRPWTNGGRPVYRRPARGEKFAVADGTRSIYDHTAAIVELGGKGSLYTFNDDGSIRRPTFGPGGLINSGSSSEDLSTYQTDGGEFGGRYDDYLLSVPSERYSTFGTLNYEISDNLRFVADAQYSKTSSLSATRARSAYGYDYVPEYSPFITQEMIDANGGSITAPIAFTRRYTELGQSITRYKRSSFQVSAGLEGSIEGLFSSPWDWNLSYSFGQSRQKYRNENATADGRYFDSLDSADFGNGPVCSSGTIGCVAVNPFKPLTQEMIDYLQYDTDYARQKLNQHVVSGYVTGALFSLPAGDVQAVIGGEYRSETAGIGVIPQYEIGNPLYDSSLGNTSTAINGSYNVAEIFGELRVPLLKAKPFFETLAIEGAVRASDYSTAGRTTSYKIGGEWAPVNDLRFRVTYGQAVRAPNISELFTTSSRYGQWLADPCNYWDVDNRSSRSEFTAANCAAISPANENDYWQWLQVTQTGNPELNVETAKTLTAGAVLKPRFIPNLSFSVDYFDIKLSDAIGTFGAQQILEKCVDAPNLNNMFCDYVARDSVTNNLLGVTTSQLNMSLFRTKGLDFEANYWLNLQDVGLGANSGTLSINAAYTKLISRRFILDAEDPTTFEETKGVFGSPSWKGVIRTTYNNGPLTLNWSLRHYSGMRPSRTVSAETHSKVYTKDIFYSDVYAAMAATKQFSLYLGARNLFDKAPPRLPGAESGGANFEQGYQAGVFDVIGRTLYMGARIRY